MCLAQGHNTVLKICDNRGISLLSIAGKVMAKIQYVCVNVHLDQAGLLPESQCGS